MYTEVVSRQPWWDRYSLQGHVDIAYKAKVVPLHGLFQQPSNVCVFLSRRIVARFNRDAGTYGARGAIASLAFSSRGQGGQRCLSPKI